MKKILSGTLCALLLSAGMAAHAATELVSNGGFEEPVVAGSYEQLPEVSGWTSSIGLFEIQKSDAQPGFSTAFEGNQYLEINSTMLSSVSQTLSTIAGQVYNLSFAFAGRADTPGGAESGVQVSFGANPIASITAAANGVWTLYNYTFTALGTSTILAFHSFDPVSASSYGSYLDAVSVSAVPEPETYAMMLVGLGLVGFAARRRKQPTQRVLAA